MTTENITATVEAATEAAAATAEVQQPTAEPQSPARPWFPHATKKFPKGIFRRPRLVGGKEDGYDEFCICQDGNEDTPDDSRTTLYLDSAGKWLAARAEEKKTAKLAAKLAKAQGTLAELKMDVPTEIESLKTAVAALKTALDAAVAQIAQLKEETAGLGAALATAVAEMAKRPRK